MCDIVKNRGFTLIELIIAVAISAVVFASVYAAFNLGIKTWRRTGGTEAFQKTRIRLLKLQKELKNSFFFSKIPFRGDASTIVFPLSMRNQDEVDTYIIIYYVEQEKGLKKLIRKEKIFKENSETEEKEESVFSANSIKFEYAYKTGQGSPAFEWQDSWGESQGKMPSAVRVSFGEDNGKELYSKVIFIPQGELGAR